MIFFLFTIALFLLAYRYYKEEIVGKRSKSKRKREVHDDASIPAAAVESTNTGTDNRGELKRQKTVNGVDGDRSNGSSLWEYIWQGLRRTFSSYSQHGVAESESNANAANGAPGDSEYAVGETISTHLMTRSSNTKVETVVQGKETELMEDNKHTTCVVAFGSDEVKDIDNTMNSTDDVVPACNTTSYSAVTSSDNVDAGLTYTVFSAEEVVGSDCKASPTSTSNPNNISSNMSTAQHNKRESESEREDFRYAVFKDLHSRGQYFVGPADGYGGDYSLYKGGGDPTQTHSIATVRIVEGRSSSSSGNRSGSDGSGCAKSGHMVS